MGSTALESGSPKPPSEPPPPAAGLGVPGRSLPPVLGTLMSGTFWLVLRTPLQIVKGFWTLPLMIGAFGEGLYGAYQFAWGFGFFQALLEFGMSSALQREVSERWTRDDRGGVNRALTCGILFYAAMALVQIAALMVVAYGVLPGLSQKFSEGERDLILQLLWLQALTAPCYGANVVISSVLQAARRYNVIPRFELLVLALQFGLLVVGIRFGLDILTIVIAQTVLAVALGLGPALWVIAREIGYVPRFVRVGLGDFRGLARISVYMSMVQLSVVLADKLDVAVLGFAADDKNAAIDITVYSAVSRPFMAIRQMGWTLAYFVMPAVASLTAAGDRLGLDRVKYDGARMHAAAVLPVGLLAYLYAFPFLALLIGDELENPGRLIDLTRLMRLFLWATLPLLVAVHVQMATGLGRLGAIAVAALVGGVINLPLSYVLTLRMGVAGVIWGTVLTTLVSNLLVPGIITFRMLEIRPMTYLRRTLLAPASGASAMLLACWALGRFLTSGDPLPIGGIARYAPFAMHLAVGCLVYVAGYAAVPDGRGDIRRLLRRLPLRSAP